jgi:D-alanine-D-alanine ligase
MKIAVVYNEAYPEIKNEYSVKLPKNLGFKPYFDIEQSDPIAEYENIAKILRSAGHNAYIINLLDDLDKFLNDYQKNSPDVIFNFVEIYKDNAQLEMSFAGLMEMMKIPFTGASSIALGTCQNKTLAKRILKENEIPTPKFRFIKKKRSSYKFDLNFPIIVKPAFEDASVGIENDSIVNNNNDLKKRVEYILDYYLQPALIEEFIDGRELNVAVMGDKRIRALPISEIDFSRMPDHLYNIVSYQAKWDPLHESYHKTIPKCPAKLPQKIELEAKEIAIKCFKTMKCRDYARIDMRLSKDNKLYVLEVNPNPDLTEDAGFMRSAKQAGMSYRKALLKIVDYAIKRGVNSQNFNKKFAKIG